MKILAEAKNLWMKLNLRGAILTSLSLQVFLIFFAPFRKRCSKRWIVRLTWSAYLVANLVADYALGLISEAQFTGGPSESKADAYGDLMAFWAPFLLLHLGGPDTITAFALEDNELWRRHLLNLLFQLVAAGYVFYQSLPSNKLIVPTILMFIGGTTKYIERIRALYIASFSKLRDFLLTSFDARLNIRSSMEMMPEPDIESQDVGAEDKTKLDDREVIKAACFYSVYFIGVLVDLPFSFHERNRSREFFRWRTAKDAFRVIEAELNYFYDVLYDKALKVYYPIGFLSRTISIGSIITAFALFYVLNKHDFDEYDILITYTLLLGAVGLEFVALIMLICSDWTIARLGICEEHRRCLSIGSSFIEFLLKFRSEGSSFALHILHARWSKSIFQYNLIDSRLRKWPKWIEKPLDLIPLGKFLKDSKPGWVKPYSDKLGELIFKEMKRKSSYANDLESIREIRAARGQWALEHSKTQQICEELLPFIRDVDYDESLLLWHVATELCYNTDTNESTNLDNDETRNHRVNSKVLSDYMLHLMIKQPVMMSAVAGFGKIRFRYTCAETDKYFSDNREDIFDKSEANKRTENACKILLSVKPEARSADVKGDGIKSVLFDAGILAKDEVWVELLAYAAIHCRPDMHAQQLSTGGELVTLVWLLMVHFGLSEHFQIVRP
ncbi:hypothetical protein ACJRO7_004150 [Eucalyptus globulus]|uniref:DUF4220 domain-containing protein n=1 Tax=Eucalyptus globulus TaxID=34317 RepID=A0ABD3IW10_EUCGL